ncbi:MULTISPECIES: PLP-dependent aminotransferase family protein [unclassified Arthrobacter]|uniref:aminotransferase-like domain-containing protein n=1 Tax=unclassified Arthrobacter TaxID=235627 RepID=UPI00159D2FD8|nr:MULTISPECIES: PLP-dependent aminotransferase family protein [unclassified Arthrobacter]MCQ9165557.1 PLP-dependent aminotransferase family protein [Arthrobacter sp. STN4]NVN00772.1 PLP-dependent aminotransferase family protein [Arthrobacter sp. SDTb3-6]
MTANRFDTRSRATLPLADRAADLVGSVIDSSTSLLAAQSHDIVRFAMGSPADEAVPLAEFRDIADTVIDHSSMTYGATEGEPVLLKALVGYLAGTSEPTSEERITITAGGMQGLDLACKIFINPGDLVIVESPTYTNGSATALSYGAELLEAPMDENGLIVEALPELVAATGRTPKAIYTIPNFQNPSGTTLSLPRRHQLLELAHRWNSVIIDDDPYGLLRFEGQDLPSLQALSPGDPLLFSVRTFSKILAPGLRVGWVDTDPALRQLVINAKQAMDTCANVPAQHIIAEFIRRGGLDGHLAGLRTEYKRRKDAMQESLRRHLGGRVTTTDPEGGFFLWLTLQGEDARISTRRLFETALAEGVAFIPGPALSASGKFDDALRLCFATTTPERAEEGIVRLRRAVDRELAGMRVGYGA